MQSRRKYLVFGLAAALALVAVAFGIISQLSVTSAVGGGPEMKLTVKDGGECSGDECTVAEGGAFTLSVEIVAGPSAGYVLAQSWVDYGSDLVYKPTEMAADEVVWEDCAALTIVRNFEPAMGNPKVNHGCLSGLLPPLPVSTYVGNFVDLAFNCSAASSTTEVKLLAQGTAPALTNGALFSLPDNSQVTPKVSNLTINCGEGGNGEPTDTPTQVPTEPTGPTSTPTTAGPTNTPTNTATARPPTATNTPRPPTPTNTPTTRPCGDANDDERVDSRDALWVLWYVARLIREIDMDFADVNGDGDVTSIDAGLILQKDAGLIGSSALTC